MLNNITKYYTNTFLSKSTNNILGNKFTYIYSVAMKARAFRTSMAIKLKNICQKGLEHIHAYILRYTIAREYVCMWVQDGHST